MESGSHLEDGKEGYSVWKSHFLSLSENPDEWFP